MNASRWQSPLFIWLAWLLFGLFLQTGPAAIQQRLAQFVLDGAGESLSLIDQSLQWQTASTRAKKNEESTRPENESRVKSLQQQNRDLAVMIAQLKEENSLLKTVPGLEPIRQFEELAKTIPVEARILGVRGESTTGAERMLISLGKTHGLMGEEFVLAGEGYLIDGGVLSGVTTDQLVSFGQTLFGRTIQVGRWTTLVQPVTDPEFRTAVRLIRRTEFGTVMGARGILQGTGNGCEMIEVAGTEPVAVGDFVYTDQMVSPTAAPIYCGQVTKATIAPSAPHWQIEVTPPSAGNFSPQKLTVLKLELDAKVKTKDESNFE